MLKSTPNLTCGKMKFNTIPSDSSAEVTFRIVLPAQSNVESKPRTFFADIFCIHKIFMGELRRSDMQSAETVFLGRLKKETL